jgi:tetratricopeptide (TPR) repeat protein
VKILFLAANPVDVVTRLRIDIEIREISERIRMGPLRGQLDLVPELAVRAGDLQEALLRNQPDIVHFSGHCNPTGGIVLEDEAGKRKLVESNALCDLFAILKDNIRVVVLNACYAQDLAQALSRTIDFTIGMKEAIDDKAAIIFSAHFYQSLAHGRPVKEAFELAVNQLELEGLEVAHAPALMVREGVDASRSWIIKPSRPITFLPWLLASAAMGLTTDVMRRFLGGEDGWWDIGANLAQPVLIAVAVLTTTLFATSIVRPANPLVVKASGFGLFKNAYKARRAVFLTLIILVIACGLWLSLPDFARYYNERGIRFQYREKPDLSRARESYLLAVRLKPNFAQAHYNLATVDEDLHIEKAMEEYLLAIRYDSFIYSAYNNLARLYILRGKENDYESALSILSRASDLAPADENVQYSLNKNLGWAHYALKHYSLAEMYLRRAISLRKKQGGAAAHCLLAYVLKEQGNADAADECFFCVSLAPGENDVEAKWLSDAQDCLMRGGDK